MPSLSSILHHSNAIRQSATSLKLLIQVKLLTLSNDLQSLLQVILWFVKKTTFYDFFFFFQNVHYCPSFKMSLHGFQHKKLMDKQTVDLRICAVHYCLEGKHQTRGVKCLRIVLRTISASLIRTRPLHIRAVFLWYTDSLTHCGHKRYIYFWLSVILFNCFIHHVTLTSFKNQNWCTMKSKFIVV